MLREALGGLLPSSGLTGSSLRFLACGASLPPHGCPFPASAGALCARVHISPFPKDATLYGLGPAVVTWL